MFQEQSHLILVGTTRNKNEILDYKVSDKKVMFKRDSDTGHTVKVDVPEDLREKRVLSTDEITKLADLGKKSMNTTTSHRTQNGQLKMVKYYMLQSRPVTTLNKKTMRENQKKKQMKGL